MLCLRGPEPKSALLKRFLISAALLSKPVGCQANLPLLPSRTGSAAPMPKSVAWQVNLRLLCSLAWASLPARGGCTCTAYAAVIFENVFSLAGTVHHTCGRLECTNNEKQSCYVEQLVLQKLTQCALVLA